VKTGITRPALDTRQPVHTTTEGEPAKFSGKLAAAREAKKETTSALAESGKGSLSPAWNGFESLPNALKLMTFMQLDKNKMFNQYVTLGGKGPPEYSPAGLRFLKEHGLKLPHAAGRSNPAWERLSPLRLYDIGREAVFRILGVESGDKIDKGDLMTFLGSALHSDKETSAPVRTEALTTRPAGQKPFRGARG
jgi:hypothetical protein